MAYNPNIPQPTDILAQSQNDLLNNFQALSTYLNVNHVDFNGSDQGKHKFITLPAQVASPPIAFGVGEVALYSFLNPITLQNELYVNKTNQVTVTQIPATASILSVTSAPGANSAGWTYLPSGILLKWGNASANGITATNFPVAIDIPVFNVVFSMQISTYDNGLGDSNTFARLGSFNNLSFNVYGSSRTGVGAAAVNFQYLAIGY